MKKIKRLPIIAIAIVLVAAVGLTPVLADTIYYQDGYYYSRNSVSTATLYGRNMTDSDLQIPKNFGDYYVTNIADSSFEDDLYVQSLSFANATLLERIGFYAFKNCTNLSGNVTFGGRINNLGNSAFEGCNSLQGISFLGYVTSISDQCFYQCSALSSVVLNNRVNSIGKYAFSECTSLEYLELPRSLANISETAFDGDENLTLGVYYDSYAYTYAKNNDIPFVLLDTVMLGDANSDGIVNINDVTAIQRHVAEFEVLEDLQAKAADVNRDGSITIEDATILQQYLAEYEIDVPIGVA